MSGQLRAGQRLVEAALASEHQVSRVPVREALRRLESEGFVKLTPHRGATVSETSLRDSLELMQVRRGLETFGARLAAERRGGEAAEDLLRVIDRGRTAARLAQVQELPALIMEFHTLVAAASGNRNLERMLDRILQSIAWGFELDLDRRVDSSWNDHTAIATAIVSGSAVQAAFLMDEHIAKDEALYLARYGHPDDEPR